MVVEDLHFQIRDLFWSRQVDLGPEFWRDGRVVMQSLLDGSSVVNELNDDLSLSSMFALQSLGEIFEGLADGLLAV